MPTQINDEGKYCPFPGTTVISTTQESDAPFWQQVYDCLEKSPILRKYYAPLPRESYHMTSFALHDIADLTKGENWLEFIDKKIETASYSKLHDALSQQKISPKVTFGILMYLNGIILEVRLPKAQSNTIKELAKQFDCENGVPVTYHITLAYRYKDIMEEDYLQIEAELESLKSIFKQKKTTTLNPPQLCYFNDMTCFTPWKGATNPFRPSFLYRFYHAATETISSVVSNTSLYLNYKNQKT